MKLTVVIVSYNVKYYLAQCLESLFKGLEGIASEVVVVDNASTDGSVEFVRAHFPKVRIIANTENLGFAKANNLAIRESCSQYVLLLNPDTLIGEKVIANLLAFMDSRPLSGAAGVRMLHADGKVAKESRRGIPDPLTAFFKMSGLCERFPHHHRMGKYYMSYLPWDAVARIEIVSGAFCMLRREALQDIGLLDEDFFMYGEDIDLSFRLCKGGWENWYLPLDIIHYKGESTKRTSYRYVYVFYDAMLIFLRKHYAQMMSFLRWAIKAAVCLKALSVVAGIEIQKCRKRIGWGRHSQAEVCCFVSKVAPVHQQAFHEFMQQHSLKVYEDVDAAIAAACPSDKDSGNVYVVYDCSTVLYAEMMQTLRLASAHPFKLAMFHPEWGVMITDKCVYQ